YEVTKKSSTIGTDATSAAHRTQRRRHSAATRIRNRALVRLFFVRTPVQRQKAKRQKAKGGRLLPFAFFLFRSDRHHPMPSHVERQFFVEAIDERRAVPIEERDEADRPLLRMAVGEGKLARVHELPPQG